MDYIKLTSKDNELLKCLRALATERKERQAQGLFVIEGLRFVTAALEAQLPLVHFVVAEELAGESPLLELLAKSPHPLKAYSAPLNLLKKISQTQNPQGIIATAPLREHNLTSLLHAQNRRLFLVMDELTDPGNMGTMIRTADAAGFDGVIIGEGCVDLYNPKCLRATMGSIFHIPCCVTPDLQGALNELKKNSVRLIAMHLKAESSPYTLDLSSHVALVVGNEARGLSTASTACADILVKIPMPGRAESLNASTAANILMFESVRQRTLKSVDLV